MTIHTEDGPCQCAACRPYRRRSWFSNTYARMRAWVRAVGWGSILDCAGLVVLFYLSLLLAFCQYKR